MTRQGPKRQIAAALLSLMVLVAFSASVWADCGKAMAEAGHSDDCHEPMPGATGDCDHHAADSPCLDADDCQSVSAAVVGAERKPAKDSQPDVVALAPAPPGIEASPPVSIPAPAGANRTVSAQATYLHCCRFLE